MQCLGWLASKMRNISVTMPVSPVSSDALLARDSGYSAPSSGYAEPASEYVAYQPSAEGAPDLTPILIGILVITGLALLFPSYVTLTAIRRRRRSVEGIQGKRLCLQRVLFQL